MCKVKCKICGDTGYAASPKHIICKCGGRFKVVPETKEERMVNLDKQAMALFNFSGRINYGNS